MEAHKRFPTAQQKANELKTFDTQWTEDDLADYDRWLITAEADIDAGHHLQKEDEDTRHAEYLRYLRLRATGLTIEQAELKAYGEGYYDRPVRHYCSR